MKSFVVHIATLITLFACCTPSEGVAQGFNWQYSSRMPMQTPTLFAGVYFSGGIGAFSGTLEVPELLPNGQECKECGPYESSGLSSLRFGVAGEQWLGSHSVLLFEADIAMSSELAESVTAPVPVFGGESVTTLLEYESDITQFSLSSSFLRRIGETHFLVGGGLGVDARLSQSVLVRQTIQGTSAAYFEENGVRSKQRVLDVVAPEYVVLSPFASLRAGYQFPLALGMFCRASAFVKAYPLSQVSNTSWTGYTSGISLSVFLGLNPRIEH